MTEPVADLFAVVKYSGAKFLPIQSLSETHHVRAAVKPCPAKHKPPFPKDCGLQRHGAADRGNHLRIQDQLCRRYRFRDQFHARNRSYRFVKSCSAPLMADHAGVELAWVFFDANGNVWWHKRAQLRQSAQLVMKYATIWVGCAFRFIVQREVDVWACRDIRLSHTMKRLAQTRPNNGPVRHTWF